MIAPHVAQLAARTPDVRFVKFDVDDSPDIAAHFNIACMPTFLIFQGERLASTVEGADLKAIQAALQQLRSTGQQATTS